MDLAKYVGEQIKKFRERRNMTQDDLAEKLGTTRQSISRYEIGERKANQDILFALSDIFGVAVDDFFPAVKEGISAIYNQLAPTRQEKVYNFASEQLEEQRIEQNKIVSFPEKVKFNWYGYVSAGTGEYLTDEVCETIELDENDVPDNADFALTVNGDSMKPMFKDHELIFVEETEDVQSGSIAVVMIDNDAYVKKIYISMDHLTLVSLNPEYDDIVVKSNDGVKIIGKVVF